MRLPYNNAIVTFAPLRSFRTSLILAGGLARAEHRFKFRRETGGEPNHNFRCDWMMGEQGRMGPGAEGRM